jgi:hypothetical protein
MARDPQRPSSRPRDGAQASQQGHRAPDLRSIERGGAEVFWPHGTIIDGLGLDLFQFVDSVEARRVRDGFKGAVWQALPWVPDDASSFVRFDPSVILQVATTGFGIPEAKPRLQGD